MRGLWTYGDDGTEMENYKRNWNLKENCSYLPEKFLKLLLTEDLLVVGLLAGQASVHPQPVRGQVPGSSRGLS